MSAAAGAKSLGFFKRAWNEKPDMVCSAIVYAIGLGLIGSSCYYYYANDLDNRKYKFVYTVVRHDDPRAAKIRKD